MLFQDDNSSPGSSYFIEQQQGVPAKKMRMAGEIFGEALGRSFQPSIRLNTRDLVIPPPAEEFKKNLRYGPTEIPLLIDREILNPGYMGAGGFGVS